MLVPEKAALDQTADVIRGRQNESQRKPVLSVNERSSAAPAAPARSLASVELIHGVQRAAWAITPLHLWV